MTKIPTEILELAVQGGWKIPDEFPHRSLKQLYKEGWFEPHKVALDREFWIALGKKLGWGDVPPVPPMWQFHAMSFFDLILSGQDPTEFWNSLIANK